MVSKTRERLLDVARQLFARKGVENTTMNDIAAASDNGRRTVYTYFKNKTDIFNALVRQEANIIIDRLNEVADLQLPPDDKLMRFIFVRFEAVKEVVGRNGTLKAAFFNDIKRVEKVRRTNHVRESAILEKILAEGVSQGMFAIKHVRPTANVMLLSLEGLDIHYIRDSFADLGIERPLLRTYIKDFILRGISCRPSPQHPVNENNLFT